MVVTGKDGDSSNFEIVTVWALLLTVHIAVLVAKRLKQTDNNLRHDFVFPIS